MIIENKEMGIRFEVDNQQDFDKWYAISKEQIRTDVIDAFIRFIFGRNIMHNRRFTTREEEYFLNMVEQFKEQLKE